MSLLVRWVAVKCQRCDRQHCDATPGAKIRFRCKRCKTLQIVET